MLLSAPSPLAEHHLLENFSSGTPSLDDWLRKRARANQTSGASRTFVVCDGTRVVGYYALASGAIGVLEATGKFRRNMPDPIPIAILARLAVDRTYQGRGLGRALFKDIAHRIMHAADTIGIRGVVVHAISEEAKAFYLALGFSVSPHDPMTLMVPLTDLRSIFSTLKVPNTRTRAAMAEADEIVRTHQARFKTATELFDDIEKNNH
ncbi:MAG: GNAT family N-acetyltransferase [Magnetococcus sp. DMHC-1]|nr:GNAT family N-acetyltransferase [Magnetococcales bacterium]